MLFRRILMWIGVVALLCLFALPAGAVEMPDGDQPPVSVGEEELTETESETASVNSEGLDEDFGKKLEAEGAGGVNIFSSAAPGQMSARSDGSPWGGISFMAAGIALGIGLGVARNKKK